MRKLLSSAIGVVMLAGTASAVDGVLEINQTCAVNTGCFSTDSAGFPIEIIEAGSYRLTGNLLVPPNTTGIVVNAQAVTVDLNGFRILGGGGAVSSDGIHVLSAHAEIRNGTLQNFSRHGLFVDAAFMGNASVARVINVRAVYNVSTGITVQAPGSVIDRCTTANNEFLGISVSGAGTIVINSVARDNGDFGINLVAWIPPGSPQLGAIGWGSNIATNNNGGNANPQVVLGVQTYEIDTNICGSDTTCP
jgi:hypothetical protein